MIEAGLWRDRKLRRKQIHQPRYAGAPRPPVATEE
jgi:hypothetical protein